MDKKKLIYFALSTMFVLTSCSQEDPRGELPGDRNRIYFRSNLPTVTLTRAEVVSAANFTTCQVTCFNTYDPESIDLSTGEIKPYFKDIRFEKDDDGRFYSQGDDECIWPNAKNLLHFFAYYPSADSMKKISGEGLFNLVNASKLIGGSAVIDYRLEKFRVAADIADQVDFLTAYSAGSLQDNGEAGIDLDFKHQLARIELSAWGANDKYDFEIAGVRIGNPVVESDFNLSALSSASGQDNPWLTTSASQDNVEHIFSPGETIVLLSKSSGSHASENAAASVMGTAGPAMVIPMSERIEGWEGKNDPAIAASPYTTDRMYFSLLLRVRNKDGEVAYPYTNDRDNMAVIYFAIDNSGKINARLYKIDGAYYTVPEKNDDCLYVKEESEEICGFGWAALPVAAKWEAGKIYTYKLNYSSGIGWHDPADPDPGEPIIERDNIPFSVSVDEWLPADDYESDINVPKR